MHFIDKDLENIKFSIDITDHDIFNFVELFIRYLCGYIQYSHINIGYHRDKLKDIMKKKFLKEITDQDINDFAELIIQYLCGYIHYSCTNIESNRDKLKDILKEKFSKEISDQDINNYTELFINYICGSIHYSYTIIKSHRDELKEILSHINNKGLNYALFNEILLLLIQNRVSEDFYKYFFLNNKKGDINKEIKIEQLKEGITRFRGFCLINFGNIINTFQSLSKASYNDIDSINKDFYKESDKIIDEFKERPDIIIDIDRIDKKNTWYLGYISKDKWEDEQDYLGDLIEKDPGNKGYKELSDFYVDLWENVIQINRNQGRKNTKIYLVWDYLDVYVATSMRNKREFEETYNSIKKIFNKPSVKNLKLRVFDPTQSFCSSMRDKGLIEGLMLKRAKCTIYMIQETDTMGKDSELAATLAQKKPVIAFVPDYPEKKLFKKIQDHELDEIEKRIYLFKAQRIFKEKEFLKNKEKFDFDIEVVFKQFHECYQKYQKEHHFTLYPQYNEDFKKIFPEFDNLCKILALATRVSFSKRALIFKDRHPLGMQIDLDSGAANGLIVVRSEDDCADILRKILTNSLEFEIQHIKDEDFGFTGLYEKTTQSLYRLITDDEILTNSFWNFFYKAQNQKN